MTNGPLTFVVPMDAPGTLHYQCSNHSAMGGTLSITDPVSVQESGVPKAAWLGPAVPNPSSRGATFRFGIPRDGPVEFAVYDLFARRVRMLAKGDFPAGEHVVRWDGRDHSGRRVPNGLYSYRLKLAGRELAGRLIVTR